MEIRTRYERRRVPVDYGNQDTTSMTKQSFKDESDINNILKRYQQTGVLVDPGAHRQPMFGDFSNGEAFRQSADAVAAARSSFELLPSNVRAFFDNNVANMLDFVADPANHGKLSELGLIESKPNGEAPAGQGPPAVKSPPAPAASGEGAADSVGSPGSPPLGAE